MDSYGIRDFESKYCIEFRFKRLLIQVHLLEKYLGLNESMSEKSSDILF